jgi:hypothetical protein
VFLFTNCMSRCRQSFESFVNGKCAAQMLALSARERERERERERKRGVSVCVCVCERERERSERERREPERERKRDRQAERDLCVCLSPSLPLAFSLSPKISGPYWLVAKTEITRFGCRHVAELPRYCVTPSLPVKLIEASPRSAAVWSKPVY